MSSLEMLQSKLSLDELKAQSVGQVVTPGEADYDVARQTWNLTFDQYPAVILLAEDTRDVALGIHYAQENNLGVSVQATGHGVILPANDCLLIVTSKMQHISIDAPTQTAWIEAGVKWGSVLEKTQAIGLAPLLGSSSDVGAVGYTLGGGMGWLARKYGMAIDSVLSFEIVTPDGHVRHASETENSDLFWALRGGAKGAIGVVTAMQIRLYPVTEVFAGSLIYPFAKARQVFKFYREWIKHLPEDWTTSIAIMHFPPMPELPPFLSGQSVVMVTGCSVSDILTAQMLLQPWLDWGQPIANTFHPMPFIESDTISNDPVDPMPGLSTGAWLRNLSDEAIDIILAHAHAQSPMMKLEIRYAGGAITRTSEAASAYGHRSETLIMQCLGITPTPEAMLAFKSYTGAFKQALGNYLSGGVYMNFLEGEEAYEETMKAFEQDKAARLAQIKATYDPHNLFRFGYAIPSTNTTII